MRRKGKRLKESKKMDRKGSKIAKPEDEVDVGPLKRERNRLLAVTMRMMLAHQKRKKVHVCRKNKLHSQSDLELVLSNIEPSCIKKTVLQLPAFEPVIKEEDNCMDESTPPAQNTKQQCKNQIY